MLNIYISSKKASVQFPMDTGLMQPVCCLAMQISDSLPLCPPSCLQQSLNTSDLCHQEHRSHKQPTAFMTASCSSVRRGSSLCQPRVSLHLIRNQRNHMGGDLTNAPAVGKDSTVASPSTWDANPRDLSFTFIQAPGEVAFICIEEEEMEGLRRLVARRGAGRPCMSSRPETLQV